LRQLKGPGAAAALLNEPKAAHAKNKTKTAEKSEEKREKKSPPSETYYRW